MESNSLYDHATISKGHSQSCGNRRNIRSSWEAGQCFAGMRMIFVVHLVTEEENCLQSYWWEA